MTTILSIIIIAVVAIILILVLIGLCFNAGFKKDGQDQGDIHYVWHDRKRNWLGWFWSVTKYSLSDDRLFIQKGLLRTQYDEVRLYRILDVKMAQSLWQKIIGTGTITVHSSDKTLGTFDVINIKKPMAFKELLSKSVESERDRHRVYSRESMTDDCDHDYDGPDVPDFM